MQNETGFLNRSPFPLAPPPWPQPLQYWPDDPEPLRPMHAPAAEGAKPNSVIDGVHIGCITYSYRGATSTPPRKPSPP